MGLEGMFDEFSGNAGNTEKLPTFESSQERRVPASNSAGTASYMLDGATVALDKDMFQPDVPGQCALQRAYVQCPSPEDHVPSSTRQPCTELVCMSADCCEPIENCSSIGTKNCTDVGMGLVENAAEKLCADAACLIEECCNILPTCQGSTFACGKGASNVGTYADGKCQKPVCAYDECCEKHQRCESAGFNCTVDEVVAAENPTCTTPKCARAECCIELPTCESSKYVCDKTTHVAKVAATARCASLVCTQSDCCEARPMCRDSDKAKEQCQLDGMILRSDTACSSQECTAVDCCESMNCAAFGFAQCTDGFHLMTNLAQHKCATGATCTNAECCDPDMICDEYTCPSGTHTAEISKGTTCPANTCSESLCCKAACRDHVCPAKMHAVESKKGQACPDNKCSDSQCCAAACRDHVCPAQMHLLESKNNHTCIGNACTDSQCCDDNPTCIKPVFPLERCATPLKQHLKNSSIACTGATCTSSECCSDNEKCSVRTCAGLSTMVFDLNKMSKPCRGAFCDVGECCEPLTCGHQDDGLLCGALRHTADASRWCTSNPCTELECCSEKLSVTCAEQQAATPALCGKKAKFKPVMLGAVLPDAQCAGNPCTRQECCEKSPNQRCSQVPQNFCRAGTHLIKRADSVVCGTFKCSPQDQARCCESDDTCEAVLGTQVGFCQTHKCTRMKGQPTRLTPIVDPAAVNCRVDMNGAQACSEATCCRALTCAVAQFNCGPGYIRNDLATCKNNKARQKIQKMGGVRTVFVPNCRHRDCCLRERTCVNLADTVCKELGRPVTSRDTGECKSLGCVDDSTFPKTSECCGEMTTAASTTSSTVTTTTTRKATTTTITTTSITTTTSVTVTSTTQTTRTTTTVTTQRTLKPSKKETLVRGSAEVIDTSANRVTTFMLGFAEPLVDSSGCAENCKEAKDRKPVFDLDFNKDWASDPLQDGEHGWLSSSPKLSRQIAKEFLDEICPAIAERTDLVIEGQVIKCDTIDLRLMIQRTTNCDSAAAGEPQAMVQALGVEFKSTLRTTDASVDVAKHYEAQRAFLHAIKTEYPQYAAIMDSNDGYKLAINELIAIYGALWGIITSLLLCFAIVVLFKANAILVGLVMLSIFGNIVVVLGSFGMAGWRLGGVEAVALSILVGTCVDYIIHMMEGYLEGKWDQVDHGTVRLSMSVAELRTELSNRGLETGGSKAELKRRCLRKAVGVEPENLREWRVRQALTSVGVPILHSAITTGGSALVLTTTELPIFKKFGQIVCINTAVSIIITMTLLPALLAMCGPLDHHESLKRSGIGLVFLIAFFGTLMLILFIAAQSTTIRGADGEIMFQ